jgi:7-carboxy-7-deazaguanine synthase
MNLHVSEKFKSIQGEGTWTGTQMAFIRLSGCSVGKTICHTCDTDFEEKHTFRGGGVFTPDELVAWTSNYERVCLTGGEPLDHPIDELVLKLIGLDKIIHVETSGTKPMPGCFEDNWGHIHLCISPKPGYDPKLIFKADEIKIIVPGLGNGKGWPDLDDALCWAGKGREVFIQPANHTNDVDYVNLKRCIDLTAEHPELRLSVQLHKVLKVQ